MNTIVLSSAALGVATARSTQRPTARGFHGVAGGRSQLRIVAQRFSTCRAVAAASSGNGASIQAAAAQAEPALLCLVAAWNSWTAQPMWRVAVVAVSALAAFMVLHSFSKQEIEDRCQYAQAVRQLGGEQPAAVMAELHRTLRKLGRHVVVYVPFICTAYIAQHVLFGAADTLLGMGARLCIECMAFADTVKWIWVFCMAQHGKASIGDQQPSMP